MKFLKTTLIATACLTLAACGNLSKVSDQGTTDNPVFPDLTSSKFNHDGSQFGSWVNWDNVRQVEAGMNKDQLHNLLGRPHFAEGFYGVREWDYVFNYRENGEHKTCQYKVLFDKDMNAQSFFWYPNGCNSSHHFSLYSDVLFDFDKDKLNEEGLDIVYDLASKLKTLDIQSITVEGYTDRLGSEEYNLALSQRRAETIKTALENLEVDVDIKAIGLGKANQVKDCQGSDSAAKECLKPNRRVVVKAEGQEVKAESNVKQAGKIGPAPLYDKNYPYAPKIHAE